MELGLSALPYVPLSQGSQECKLAGIGVTNVPLSCQYARNPLTIATETTIRHNIIALGYPESS
jgi:hypothetical protein